MQSKKKINTDVLVGSIYHHFKGHDYKIICIATDSETNNKLVVYENVEDGKIWARDYDMFISPVDSIKYPQTKQKFRFELKK